MAYELKDKYKEAENALLDFIIRVAQGKIASEAEAGVLPEVVRALKEFKRS